MGGGASWRGARGLGGIQGGQQEVVWDNHGMADALLVGWRWLEDDRQTDR